MDTVILGGALDDALTAAAREQAPGTRLVELDVGAEDGHLEGQVLGPVQTVLI